MKRIFNSSRSMRFICMLLFIAAGGALVLAARWPRHGKGVLPTRSSTAAPNDAMPLTDSEATPTSSPQTAQSAGPVQMIRFTVYDEGIRPSVAHASPGLVAIYIDDKSTHTASLILADGQHPLGAINRGQGRSRGHSTILMQSGSYTIYEANRKAQSATLIVGP